MSRDLATCLGREGFDKKACAALLSAGLCPDTDETKQALQALHPPAAPPRAQPFQELPLAPELAPDTVARAFRAFPPETAPGPTGLRVQHLRDANVAGGGESFLTQLTAVVNLLAQGQVPAPVAPVLAGAALVALPKPGGGVRPIAVGEILRRLTGKCLMGLVRQDARSFFWPAQVGVAVPGGAEKAIHTVRAWVRRHKDSTDKVLVKLDFTNAFNCVDRGVVLEQACAHFPALARFATWCYQQPSRLKFGSSSLLSSAGVQQGDPLGPLLFAAALQPVAADLRQAPLDMALHYLDDGVLAGDVPSVAAALQHVQQRAADVGLQLNLSKCETVAVGRLDPGTLHAHLPDSLLHDSAGNTRVLRNFGFLGAAVGDQAFCETHTAARVAKAASLLEALAELDGPQVGVRLLRACAGYTRMVHSMRCTPPASQNRALAEFDAHARQCFGSLTRIHLTTAQWAQALRGFSQAGLGLRSSARHAPAAFLASVGASLSACADLDAGFSQLEALASSDVVDALTALNASLDDGISLQQAVASKQHDLSKLLDAASWNAQLGHATLAERAALLSECGPGARAFLAGLPSGRTRMEKPVFVAEVRVRLGVPDALTDEWCPRCDAVLDRHSHHAAVCVAGGERTQRHNAVRDLVYTRPGLLLPQTPDDTSSARRRPADVYLPALAGSPAALDFAVTAPQRQETIALASKKTGAAAAAYARHKEQHLDTANACRTQGITFVPMVVETTGEWDAGASKVLKHIACAVAARTGEEADHTYGIFVQQLCVVVRSFRARAALRRRAEASVA